MELRVRKIVLSHCADIHSLSLVQFSPEDATGVSYHGRNTFEQTKMEIVLAKLDELRMLCPIQIQAGGPKRRRCSIST
ncbi:hypothetical protein BYT27DRAFT_6491599 [Phlegmacium glaucopus]|nr:hypothetical protein BYT27DRAFT_6491599 [Phlegmacium glaucopus]